MRRLQVKKSRLTSKKPACKQQLAAVRKALEEFYEDLDNRVNTSEYMMRTALTKIEKALDMWWGKNEKDSTC